MKTIKKVSHDTEQLEFNTAIAQMMIFMNEVSGLKELPRKIWQPFILLLAPYAPHMAEELWEKAGGAPSVSSQRWPQWEEALTVEELVEVVFQINGKIRAKENLPAGTGEAETRERALANARMRELLDGKEVRKVIVVPGKLVNVVVST
jgi:leucyl-tRNA synthetase